MEEDNSMGEPLLGSSNRHPQLKNIVHGADVPRDRDFETLIQIEENHVKMEHGQEKVHLDAYCLSEDSEPSRLETMMSGMDTMPGDPNLICSSCERRKKLLIKAGSAPAMLSMARLSNALKKPDLSPMPPIIWQASMGIFAYLIIGIAIYMWKVDEFSGKSTVVPIDAFYFCIVTMCTIGYGDIAPMTPSAKLFSCLFVMIGFGFIDYLLSGLVAYALDKRELIVVNTADGSLKITKNHLVGGKSGHMRTRTKVGLALGIVIACVAVGTTVMHHQESLDWLDAFYLSCMSVTTVGYGDHAFKSKHGRLFASIWLFVSTLAVARSFLYLAEAHIDQRRRMIAKWVLERKLTVHDMVAADLDHEGFISKSDYVVHKLKEMGKVKEKDILEICRHFNQLQISGKIRGKSTLLY